MSDGRRYCQLIAHRHEGSTSYGDAHCRGDKKTSWWKEKVGLDIHTDAVGSNSERFVFSRGVPVSMIDSRGRELPVEVGNDAWSADISGKAPLVLIVQFKTRLNEFLADGGNNGKFTFSYSSVSGGSTGLEYTAFVRDPEKIMLAWRWPHHIGTNQFYLLEKATDHNDVQGDASIYKFRDSELVGRKSKLTPRK